jgi:hypothetical protein
VPAVILPIGGELNQFETARTSPFARDPIDTASVTLNERVKSVLGVEPIKLTMDEVGIIEISATADDHLHSKTLHRQMSHAYATYSCVCLIG